MKKPLLIFLSYLCILLATPTSLIADNNLWWWEPDNGTTNFGDTLSVVLVERMVGKPITKASIKEQKLLAIGSILHFAKDGDVVWGSGVNSKHPTHKDYNFVYLDVRSVRGPLTRKFLMSLGVKVPEVYGDPALLLPRFFPEFKVNPIREYIVIPHISEIDLFKGQPNVVLPTEGWKNVVQKIVESKFVISSSLHGIIVAEAFGIPAKLLRVTENEPLFKYEDYYLGTGRSKFSFSKSIEEALKSGGESKPICDLDALYKAFPFDLYKNLIQKK